MTQVRVSLYTRLRSRIRTHLRAIAIGAGGCLILVVAGLVTASLYSSEQQRLADIEAQEEQEILEAQAEQPDFDPLEAERRDGRDIWSAGDRLLRSILTDDQRTELIAALARLKESIVDDDRQAIRLAINDVKNLMYDIESPVGGDDACARAMAKAAAVPLSMANDEEFLLTAVECGTPSEWANALRANPQALGLAGLTGADIIAAMQTTCLNADAAQVSSPMCEQARQQGLID